MSHVIDSVSYTFYDVKVHLPYCTLVGIRCQTGNLNQQSIKDRIESPMLEVIQILYSDTAKSYVSSY